MAAAHGSRARWSALRRLPARPSDGLEATMAIVLFVLERMVADYERHEEEERASKKGDSRT